jgi:hypothetical protein
MAGLQKGLPLLTAISKGKQWIACNASTSCIKYCRAPFAGAAQRVARKTRMLARHSQSHHRRDAPVFQCAD